MSFHQFEGRLKTMEWGRSTYTILRLPDAVARALSREGRRVEGEIGEHPVNLALTRAPVVEGTFLYVSADLARAVGARLGEPLEVRLRAAPDDVVEVPPDVAAALRGAGLTAKWEALTPGRRRGLLHGVASAKRAPTRAKRISALVGGLGAPA